MNAIVSARRTISLWFPVVIWAGFIFYLSSIPHLQTPWGIGDLILRKAAHITEYALLSFLLSRAMAGSFNFSRQRVFALALFVSICYSASDEIHQSFVAGRSGNIVDVLIDTAGVLVGLYLWRKSTMDLTRLKT
jgi:VanZ family protein